MASLRSFVPATVAASWMTAVLWGQAAERVFTLKEEFGVPHPRQLVTFDNTATVNAANSYMLGPDGVEVPWQLLRDNRIAVMTDLPAWKTRQFKLVEGRSPAAVLAVESVQTSVQGASYEILNSQLGLRVQGPGGDKRYAPVLGVRLHNGAWTAERALLTDQSEVPLQSTSVSSRLVENGPLQAIVEVNYAIGGGKYYKSRIVVQAGHPVAMLEEESNITVQYQLDFYSAVQPLEARYRGPASTSVALGREPDGRQYRGMDQRPGLDATRSLPYHVHGVASTQWGMENGWELIPRTLAWNPWAYNSGWYWMLYNPAGGADAPVVGFFAGRASRAQGGSSGPGAFTRMSGGVGGGRMGGINLRLGLWKNPIVRMEWGLFIGTKGQDLAPAAQQVQNIGRQMNLQGGINLNKVSRYRTTGGLAPGGSLYMSQAARNALVARVRSDTAYYQSLAAADPTALTLLDVWRDTTGAKARAMAAEITGYARQLLNILVNGEGIYEFHTHYWTGGLQMSRRLAAINDLQAAAELTAAEKQGLNAAAVLFASVLWDDDFVPMHAGVELNLGNANMPVQQGQYRDQFALLLAGHPMMAGRVERLLQQAEATVLAEINESGTHRASPHYVGASMGPLLTTAQQLKMQGSGDLFASAPRLAKFAGFHMNLMTPAESRFGGWRKLISLGDGSTEASELFGQLGTAYAGNDAALSQQLMGAWRSMGSPHSGFHGSTVLKIDSSLEGSPVDLKSAQYPGYYTVLRQGGGSRNETAAWVVNGDFYADHRHWDAGGVVLYALQAPVSLDWGSIYSPRAAGPYLHSSVLPERAIGVPWDAPNVPLDGGDPHWRRASQESFESFTLGSRSRSMFDASNGGKWRRQMRVLAPEADFPVIEIVDQFSGPGAEDFKVMSLNLMAQAEVEGPQGKLVAPQRFWDFAGKSGELPSAMPAQPLPEGISRFGFQGQFLIDWDLYVLSDEPRQFTLGNWAHEFHPTPETTQFATANGRPFRERQQILRVRGQGQFRTILLPRRKNEARKASVSWENGRTLIKSDAGAETTLGPQFWSFAFGSTLVLASEDSEEISAYGLSVQGGPAEIAVRDGKATVTVHGAAGGRALRIPGEWNADPLLVRDGELFRYEYPGGDPVTLDLVPAGQPLPARAAKRSAPRQAARRR